MALINCPECKKEISTKAKCCPNCGYALSPEDITNALESLRKQKQQKSKLEKQEIERKAQKSKREVLFVIVILLAIVGVYVGSKIYNSHVENEESKRLNEANKNTRQILPNYPVYSGGDKINKEGKVTLSENERFLKAWSTPYQNERRKEMVRLENGDKIIAFRETDASYRILSNGKRGWIPKNKVRITKVNPITEKKPTAKKYKTVRITSIADGYDVGRVNLFSCQSCQNRQILAYCTNGEKVKLITKSNGYVKVRKSNGKEGWCLEGWVR